MIARAAMPWMLMRASPLILLCACAIADAGVLDCVPAGQAVDLVLRLDADAPPRHLRLAGGQSPALRLIDPADGSMPWTAGAVAPASQIFPAMWAGFAGSLTALDLDGNGTHDRIYAGDLAGRIWRFDIHHGAGSAQLLTGGIFATLGGGPPALRGFVAPADVSLAGPAAAPWLNVAIGSASITPGTGDNRFYVLRDRAAFESWSQQQYRDWHPVTESSLSWRTFPAEAETSAATDDASGFYVTLAGGSVLTSSITVSGRAIVAVASDLSGSGSQCTAAVTISRLSLEDDLHREPGALPAGPWETSVILPGRLAAFSDFRVERAPGEALARCRLGDVDIEECGVSLGLHPVSWRREDAD